MSATPTGALSRAGGASPFPHTQSPAAAVVAAAHAAVATSPHHHTPLLGHGTAEQTQHRLRRSQQLPNGTTTNNSSPARSTHGASAAASSAAAAGSATPLAPLPLPASQLSCHAALSLHLDDYVTLLDSLLHSLDPALAMSHTASGASGTAAAAAASASGQASSDVWMRKLLFKDALLQESLRTLITHQRLQRRLQAQYAELAALDAGIINFCTGLSSLEQRLLQASNPDMLTLSTPATSVSLAAAPARHHGFSLHSLLRMSESLGRMSFAPSFFIDQRQDAFNPAVCRPPAPLDKFIQHSLLHHEPARLVAMIEEERAAKQREAEEKAAQASAAVAAAASEDTAMVDAVASSAALHASALSRQESAASALPSFAELAAAGQSAAGGVFGTPHLQRQESAQRAAGTVQPVALDLDLESSDEEDEDD